MTAGQISLPIPPDHPSFAGHFPGMPILPGVVLLDEMLHALERHCGLSCGQISNIKFLSPVRPMEPVVLHYENANPQTLKFDLRCGERRVATGSLRIEKQR